MYDSLTVTEKLAKNGKLCFLLNRLRKVADSFVNQGDLYLAFLRAINRLEETDAEYLSYSSNDDKISFVTE